MILMNLTLAETTSNATGPSGTTFTIIYIIAMVVIFYFLLIRPNKKRQRQMQNMLDSMRKGDEIVTIGGIMGKVFDIRQDCVIITTSADDTKMKFEKSAIARVLTLHDDDVEDIADDKKSKKKNEEDVL